MSDDHGNNTQLAKKLGLDRTAMLKVLAHARIDRDTLVPAEWVLRLCKCSPRIHPHFWRPDLYPVEGVMSV